MSRAALIAEAIDTAVSLGWAALGWLVFFAAAGSIIVLAAAACGMLSWNAAASVLGGRETGRETLDGSPGPGETPGAPAGRRVPLWAQSASEEQS